MEAWLPVLAALPTELWEQLVSKNLKSFIPYFHLQSVSAMFIFIYEKKKKFCLLTISKLEI